MIGFHTSRLVQSNDNPVPLNCICVIDYNSTLSQFLMYTVLDNTIIGFNNTFNLLCVACRLDHSCTAMHTCYRHRLIHQSLPAAQTISKHIHVHWFAIINLLLYHFCSTESRLQQAVFVARSRSESIFFLSS